MHNVHYMHNMHYVRNMHNMQYLQNIQNMHNIHNVHNINNNSNIVSPQESRGGGDFLKTMMEGMDPELLQQMFFSNPQIQKLIEIIQFKR
jgi:hypothetical protein